MTRQLVSPRWHSDTPVRVGLIPVTAGWTLGSHSFSVLTEGRAMSTDQLTLASAGASRSGSEISVLGRGDSSGSMLDTLVNLLHRLDGSWL